MIAYGGRSRTLVEWRFGLYVWMVVFGIVAAGCPKSSTVPGDEPSGGTTSGATASGSPSFANGACETDSDCGASERCGFEPGCATEGKVCLASTADCSESSQGSYDDRVQYCSCDGGAFWAVRGCVDRAYSWEGNCDGPVASAQDAGIDAYTYREPRVTVEVKIVDVQSSCDDTYCTLSSDEISSRLERNYLKGIERCFKDWAKMDPTVSGRATIHFTVATTGRVSEVRVEGVDNDAATSCLQNRGGSWRWSVPKDEDGEAVEVEASARFHFEAD